MDKKVAKRTDRQNRAMHLYFTHLAQELNDAGYDVQTVLKQKVAVDWTPELVKEVLWRTVQKVIYKKRSTTELRKAEEIGVIYDHLNRHLSEKFEIHVPFPHYETEEDYVKATSEVINS